MFSSDNNIIHPLPRPPDLRQRVTSKQTVLLCVRDTVVVVPAAVRIFGQDTLITAVSIFATVLHI